jgi:hypothetical protein
MGLGPLVCPRCLVYAYAPDETHWHEWQCPSCGTDVLEYLWMFTDDEQKTINSNSKLYRFIQGGD